MRYKIVAIAMRCDLLEIRAIVSAEMRSSPARRLVTRICLRARLVTPVAFAHARTCQTERLAT